MNFQAEIQKIVRIIGVLTIFYFCQTVWKMDYKIQDLSKSVELKKIVTTCIFHRTKYEFRQGRILKVQNTNNSFIELHRVDITIKDKKYY